MGTKVRYFPEYYYSMRDLNEDSSSSSWPVSYADRVATNGQYFNGFMPRTNNIDGHPGYGKDAMKQKMLEHEAVFKNQVYELHRLYRIQRDMMEEFKRNDRPSSSPKGSQLAPQDSHKWHMAGFPLLNSGYDNRTSISGVETEKSPMRCTVGCNTTLPYHFPFRTDSRLKDSEPRPLKVRKKLFDLQHPANDYTDEEGEKLSGTIRLADLNEPVGIEEAMAPSTVDFLDHFSINGVRKEENHRPIQSGAGYLGVNEESLLVSDGYLVNKRGWSSHLHETGSSPVPDMLNRAPGSHPFVSSSCFTSSRAHPVPFWAKPTASSIYKLTATESCLYSPGNLRTSPQIGEKLLNPGFVNERTENNGFYHGSDSSGDHAFGCVRKSFSRVDKSKPVTFIDLNEREDRESKTTTLPWLTRKPERANESAVTDLNQPFVSKVTSDCEMKKDISENINVKKIPGFPIFEKSKNGMIDINLECQPDDDEICVEILNVDKEKNKTRDAFVRDRIDLNSCVSDCEEDVLASSVEIDLEAPVEKNITVEAASVQLLQNKKDLSQDEFLQNAAEIMVAISTFPCPEIGSFHKSDAAASLSESLTWLANQLTTNVLMVRDRPGGPDSPLWKMSEEMDDFEAMTLRIQGTKEEDYMPTPFVPEFQNFQETGFANINTSVTRSRRGQSRRRRQRRDFQRDILPGLASLTRHEVTEDILTFGGLMRATGHDWVSGLTKRKGIGRGRRRAAIEIVSAIPGSNDQACIPMVGQVGESTEGGLEKRSLTGWGKTTRRPRRQRCPTGNNNNYPPAVVFT